MAIYTKTGDTGTTSLFGGKRVKKFDIQVEAYGDVDELTSNLGMVSIKIPTPSDKEFITSIQKDLYTIMGVLAGYKQDLQRLDAQTTEFETKIDQLDKQLPKLTQFIIPGGTELASWLHICRTICRRAERRTTQFVFTAKLQKDDTHQIIIRYLNRLSDLLFTFARFYSTEKELLTKTRKA